MSLISFPRPDRGVLQWSQNFLDHIQLDAAAYNLDSDDVAEYQIVHQAFASALAACDPAVCNRVASVAKNAAAMTLKITATRLAYKVHSSPWVTLARKIELNIPPRAKPTIVPAPPTAPMIQLVAVAARTVTIRLRDANGARRGKPPATAGASILSYAGPAAPADLGQWQFKCSVGRVEKIEIPFPATLPPGTTVWFTAFWFNAKKEHGPLSQALAVNLPGGGVQLTRQIAE